MLVLGIESSCDETGLALIDENGIRARILSTQVDLHALFGGVVPELASREHAKLLPSLFDALIKDADIDPSQIEGIAVANGPGLLGSLLVGVAFAKALALALNIPIIAVNHLHAHLAVLGLENELLFPALGLLVSGGHTHLYRIENLHSFTLLGKTLDDAAGEACDKFAKMLSLPYPGGALIDMLAQKGQVQTKLFPRPYTKNNNLDFSFSGLKTAASQFLAANPNACLEKHTKDMPTLADHKKNIEKAPQILCNTAASYLFAIANTLTIKAERALLSSAFSKPPQSFLLAGGVAANSFVREECTKLAKKHNLLLAKPSLKLCTDNGDMIAYLGRYLLLQGFRSELDFPAFPRGASV